MLNCLFFCENGELALIIVDQGQGQGVMGIGGLKKGVGCAILIGFGNDWLSGKRTQ